jgi:superfamily I DNA/RNA helicase
MYKQAGRRAQATPKNVVELIRFMISFSVFVALKGEADAHTRVGAALVNRYAGSGKLLDTALEEMFKPLLEIGTFTQFRDEMERAKRGTPLKRGVSAGEFFKLIMLRLNSNPKKLEEMLSDARAYSVGRKISSSLDGEDAEILSALCVIPVTGLRQMFTWVKTAADIAGEAVDPTEQALADVESGRIAGEAVRKVKAELTQVDPLSRAAETLEQEKQRTLDVVDEIASESAVPSVVFGAAAQQAAAAPYTHATRVGKEQRLSRDQEQAMMVSGLSIIAAGAGSGKTRVLASKVVYHTQEQGAPLGSVIACSFSRKSAAELKERIAKYGKKSLPDKGPDVQGLGTTHSVIAGLGQEEGILPARNKSDELKEYEKLKMVKLAIKQVGNPRFKSNLPVPEVSGFFTGIFGGEPQPQSQQGLTLEAALKRAWKNRNQIRSSWLRGWIEGVAPGGKFHSWFKTLSEGYKNPYKAHNHRTRNNNLVGRILDDLFYQAKVPYRLATDPNHAQNPRTAATKKKVDTSLTKLKEWTNGAGQWFNLGRKEILLSGMVEGVEADPDQDPPPGASTYAREITKFKGRLISPLEAWYDKTIPDEVAAVYAAYEWMKSPGSNGNFSGKQGFDDLFINFISGLLRKPSALGTLQTRFKTILVDEAQDLNRAQHTVFGLIAGYIDPAKVENVGTVSKISDLAKDDGTKTANVYCLIGDDKQAIYEFRGADPEAFIDMSDLVEGGAGFETKILETNYRSGKEIVGAAQNLIDYNTKQIPMVCDANPARGEGAVEYITFEPVVGRNYQEPAKWLAEDIEERIEADGGDGSYNDYGIGLRTNAEAYMYGLELLQKRIPFRTKANFFNDPTTKAIKGWMTIANDGGKNDEKSNARVKREIVNTLGTPTSFIGKKAFEKAFQKVCPSDVAPVEWLGSVKNQGTLLEAMYGQVRNYQRDAMKGFVKNLQTAMGRAKDPHDQIVNHLLNDLVGKDGTSIMSSLMEKVEQNADKMEALASESPDGVVDDGMIEAEARQALVPIQTLLKASSDLGATMSFIERLEIINGQIVAEDDPDAKDFKRPAVTLGTMHSWKGLEVSTMYVPMVGGVFPRISGDTEEEREASLASERRLAYVAVTRAENSCVVMNIPKARKTSAGVVITSSQFPDELKCPPGEDKRPGRTASELPEEEFEFLNAQMTDDMDRYFAEGKGSKLAASWGTTLFVG